LVLASTVVLLQCLHTAQAFTLSSTTASLASSWRSDLDRTRSAQDPVKLTTRRRVLEVAVSFPLSTWFLPRDAHAASVVPSMWGVPLPLSVDGTFRDGGSGIQFKELYSGFSLFQIRSDWVPVSVVTCYSLQLNAILNVVLDLIPVHPHLSVGQTPSKEDTVKVLVSTFSMGGNVLGPREFVEKVDLSKETKPALKAALLNMKMGAQQVLVLPPDSTSQEQRVVFVKLLAITGHICSSDEEERRKGNFLDFHTCGEVTESTEKVRLFCEKAQCVEQGYLDVQSRNAARN